MDDGIFIAMFFLSFQQVTRLLICIICALKIKKIQRLQFYECVICIQRNSGTSLQFIGRLDVINVTQNLLSLWLYLYWGFKE